MKIAIIGSTHAISERVIEKAKALGSFLASKGHIVVTGATPGYPDVVALAAVAAGGKAIAYGGGKNAEDHHLFYPTDLSKYSRVIFQETYVGEQFSRIDLYYRSLKFCFEVDAAIVIGGRVGTLYELTILAGTAKDIYVLNGVGGIAGKTVKEFLKEGHKEESKMMFFDQLKEIEKFF